MTNSKFSKLFGHKVRDPSKEDLNQFHMDIAASIQKVTEEIMLKMAKSLKEVYKKNNLCLAGGVALNCVANGKIHKEKIFKNIFVQPAAGDAGGSLGAALAFWHLELKNKRKNYKNKHDSMKGSYLGPEFSNDFIIKELKKFGAVFETFNQDEIIEKTAKIIADGKSCGWFQSRWNLDQEH